MTPIRRRLALSLLLLGLMFLSLAGGTAQTSRDPKKGGPEGTTLPADFTKAFQWRCVGPANMGGRIVALSVYEADPMTYWVATASGGLLKTTNNGVSFEHQFDRETTVSIGDVCVAPSDPKVVWVGTGENNPRNSVSYGDGVYKSTDGGKSWTNMGLKKSYQIGKLAIHPKNPDTVYVGALGRLYGSGGERGVYKTTDGGKTWDCVLHVDDKTGVIDLRMHPTEPDTLLAAMWERRRDEFDSHPGGTPPEGYDGYDPMMKWGPGAGIYKTTDGGKNWKKLSKGLPASNFGRVGLDYYHKDPNVVFTIIDCEKIGMGSAPREAQTGSGYIGIQGEDADDNKGARLTEIVEGGPADKSGLKVGDVVRKIGDKEIANYRDLLTASRAAKVGDKVKFEVVRDNDAKTIEVAYGARPGTTRPNTAYYAGQRENAQQGNDPEQFGGIYRSADGGESWTRVNSLNPRPMYFSQIRVDPTDEKYIYVLGVSFHRSTDGGKTFPRQQQRPQQRPDPRAAIHADQHALWINPADGRHMIIGTDGGFYVSYDRGATWDHHNHMAIGQFYHVAVCNKKPYWVYGGLQDNGSWGGPSQRGPGPINEDWVSVGSGDGFVCRVDLTDPDLVYAESQNGAMRRYNLRTGEERGIRPPRVPGTTSRFNWNTPFILSAHNSSVFYCGGSVVYRSVKKGDDLRPISPEIARTKRGSATAVAESPLNPDVLWAGTDDGYLWVTRNGGKDWAQVSANVKLPGPRWVSTIEPSRFAEGRCYVTFDGHRSDDDDPYAFVSEDYGKTWESIRGNLPWGSTRCLREDAENPNLLYCGTEFAVFASCDRGKAWTRLNNNLPTVAVHEIAVHPTAGEIVAATHGRSLWILDVTPLRQMTAEVFKDKPTLLKPNTVVRTPPQPTRGRTNRRFVGQNPGFGAQVYYCLPAKADKVTLRVLDIDGAVLGTLQASTQPGLHKSTWSMTRAGGGRPIPAGAYRVVLTVNDKEYAQSFRIEGDPIGGRGRFGEDEEEEEEEEEWDP